MRKCRFKYHVKQCIIISDQGGVGLETDQLRRHKLPAPTNLNLIYGGFLLCLLLKSIPLPVIFWPSRP